MTGHALTLSEVASDTVVGCAELCEAQRCCVCGLRSAMLRGDGVSAEAGSRPGGRPTFLWQQESRQRSAPRFNAARFAHGPLRCSRRRGPAELALASLGARTVLGPAVLRTSEPGNAALLGVSEGDGKASTIDRFLVSVARTQAEGRSPGGAVAPLTAAAPDSAPLQPGYEQPGRVDQQMVLTLGPVESAEWRSGVGGSARSADGEDCLRPAGPSSAAARLREHAREVRRLRLTANAGCPSLWFLSLGQARERNPAAGTDSRPTHASKSPTPIASRPPKEGFARLSPTFPAQIEMLVDEPNVKP
ncbi:hypothetical protein GGR36_000698 [Niveibacterium umoris]|uniref:Uncharacterized protein n=1 Tax=Niveibacterium umoris TaxID=1193620 RepID=A0A840BEE3_9RHOO|nr:hypothetical protein [Niveibacterium umoris]